MQTPASEVVVTMPINNELSFRCMVDPTSAQINVEDIKGALHYVKVEVVDGKIKVYVCKDFDQNGTVTILDLTSR